MALTGSSYRSFAESVSIRMRFLIIIICTILIFTSLWFDYLYVLFTNVSRSTLRKYSEAGLFYFQFCFFDLVRARVPVRSRRPSPVCGKRGLCSSRCDAHLKLIHFKTGSAPIAAADNKKAG